MTHFALLAHTLMGFYRQETYAAMDIKTRSQGPPPIALPEPELAIYAGPYFALLLPSSVSFVRLPRPDFALKALCHPALTRS